MSPDCRTYGTTGPTVIVLHGGPADRGGAEPIARGLAGQGNFHVLEPWQRLSGEEPLSVEIHIADLHDLIMQQAGDSPPALVGHSWGAMLALAYAAAHPESVGPIVLVGSGTYDVASRERMQEIYRERTDDELRERLDRLQEECQDPARRQIRKHAMMRPLYTYEDADPGRQATEAPSSDARPFDKKGHGETWGDMMRLQQEGHYPAAFSAIRSPVLMLHGAYDPHPGPMIRDSLLPWIPQLEYYEWEKCGHYPWEEKFVGEEFFVVLGSWLKHRLEEFETPGEPTPALS